jgi:hypothetical protein
MSNVTPIRRCLCGKLGTQRTLVYDEHDIATFIACDVCIAGTTEQLKKVRPIFHAMLTAGVNRDDANDAMSYLLNLIDERKPSET